MTGWNLPSSLRAVTFDCKMVVTIEQSDITAFAKRNGSKLDFLDLCCTRPLDLGQILVLCPELSTFVFNTDCRLEEGDGVTSTPLTMAHAKISEIGLHGLGCAFEVGHDFKHMMTSHADILRAIQQNNDLHVGLLNKTNFPNLRCLRILDKTVLAAFNMAGRPGSERALERWQTWSDTTQAANIRLEDCIGELLGILPDSVDGQYFAQRPEAEDIDEQDHGE